MSPSTDEAARAAETADAPQSTDDCMSAEELAAACDERAATYGLLARLYRSEVDAEALSGLVAMRYPVSSGNELMDSGYYKIAKYLSNEWVGPETKLAIDFSRAFLGAGIDAHSAAYPFESVYTSEKRLLMQDSRDEVLAIYRANGLDKAEGWKVGEDHIAVELEFMRILCLRMAKALRAGDEDKAFRLASTQRNFAADHLAAWVPAFTADVRRFASTLFYQGIADLTEGFLAEEEALLDGLVLDGSDDSEQAAQP